MIDPNEALEAAYDRYDNNGEHDAATLREMVGMETPDASEFTAEAIKARNPELQFVEDTIADVEPAAEPVGPSVTKNITTHPNPKHGLNRRSWEVFSRTPEQQHRIEGGVEAARLAIAEARKRD